MICSAHVMWRFTVHLRHIRQTVPTAMRPSKSTTCTHEFRCGDHLEEEQVSGDQQLNVIVIVTSQGMSRKFERLWLAAQEGLPHRVPIQVLTADGVVDNPQTTLLPTCPCTCCVHISLGESLAEAIATRKKLLHIRNWTVPLQHLISSWR